MRVPRRNRPNDTALPPALLRSTPRHARLNGWGVATLIVAVGIMVAGSWGVSVVYRAAKASERRVAQLATHGTIALGQVTRVDHRGSGGDSRARVHYQYYAGRQYAGATDMRQREAGRFAEGSNVRVRYLSVQPGASWIAGYEPRRRAAWPAFVILPGCFAGAAALVALLRRQASLLSYGRVALARVTKLDKKRTDEGTAWRVHYEWNLLSGAKRQGRYMHSGKEPPPIGATIPIVYDRDEPSRNSKYPLALIKLTDSHGRTS